MRDILHTNSIDFPPHFVKNKNHMYEYVDSAFINNVIWHAMKA